VIPAELGSIVAVGRSGAFQMLVGLKKRNAVLVIVSAPEVVVGAEGVVGAGAEGGSDGVVGGGLVAVVSGLVEGLDSGATGREVADTGLGDGVGEPEPTGLLGWPAITGA
jgi:hypothetical protein